MNSDFSIVIKTPNGLVGQDLVSTEYEALQRFAQLLTAWRGNSRLTEDEHGTIKLMDCDNNIIVEAKF